MSWWLLFPIVYLSFLFGYLFGSFMDTALREREPRPGILEPHRGQPGSAGEPAAGYLPPSRSRNAEEAE